MAYPPHQGGPPTSFKTNVNRAKTKRWVEAKSYTYDGDDWGDMDEYDEYGGYDEPPPPPRPTGLRQRGQSASREQPGYRHHQQSQHTYGNLGRQSPAQQQHGARSATNPPYQQSQLQRSGSFDQVDERRAFSAAGPHQGPPPTSGMYQETPYAQGSVAMPQYHQSGEGLPHPSNYLDMQDRPVQRDRNYHQSADNPPSPYPEQQHRTTMDSRTQSMTSNNSTNDLHSRRDFLPSAVPPPLQTRGSPSPQRSSEHQSLSRPPRKSSLGQQNHPEQLHARQAPMPLSEIDQEGRPAALRERAGSDLGKPLPFVRPADIYRRMQEERERERQSQDSSRPSMDVIMADDRSKNDPRSDSIGASERGREFEDKDAPRPFMNPVTERGSENDISGIPSNETEVQQAPKAEQNVVAEPAKVAEPSGINTRLSPQLPDVARMSGFGELFASAPRQSEASTPSSASQRDDAAHSSLEQPSQGRSGSPLQHQPSLGFRSVVHQAFDITNEPIPETPISSTADSSIGRSGSGGTSAVSPIISRGPSSATTNLHFRDPQNRPATPPARDERDIDDRPMSSGSLGTPKADPRRYSPDPTDPRPAKFMPGHRRDLSTPSPDNSPARTPALEANKQMQQPQEAELATTTPIETRFPHSYEQTTKPSSGRTSPPKSIRNAQSTSPIKSPSEDIPNSPAESTRSRVRNLADRFESGRSSPAGSERAPSPIKTNFGPNSVTSQPRPLPADRLESFRPKLPGGWESSASIAPLAAPNKNEATRPSVSLEQRLQNTAADRSSPSDALPSRTSGQVQTQDHQASSPSEAQGASPLSNPFASLAAAGSALAGAFSSVVGAEENGSNRDQSVESPLETARRSDSSTENEGHDMTAPRLVMDNSYIPEASKPMMLATPDDGTSSIMPTPLDKVSHPSHSEGNRAADYFTSGTDPQQQSSVDSGTTHDGPSKKRPVLLPSLSTDNGSQYESDRLRREIIRELSPRLTSEPSTAESISSVQHESMHAAQPRQQHESFVIPREYDSYWNGSDSGRSSQATSPKGPPQEAQGAMDVNVPKLITLSPRYDAEKPSPILQEAVSRPQEKMPEMPERPQPPPHRFSWEVPSEQTTPKPTPGRNPPEPLSQSISARDDGFDTPEAPPSLHQDIAGQQGMNFSDSSQTPISMGAPLQAEDTKQSLEPRDTIQVIEGKRSMESARSDQRVAVENPTYREQSKLEPKPVSTNDAPQQHRGIDPGVEIAPSSPEPLSKANDVLLPPVPPNVAPKIQSFREILSLKEARDRIKGYNEAREQFANMDTGLAHWLAVTTTELPEHKEILPNGKLAGISGAKPLTSRTNKLGGLLPSNSFTHQLHNANSPLGTSDGAQVAGGNTHHGHSPSGGSVKLSSQQRGKDLLHTAGVFGGKANVAAKGLFSKGKSKLRGANADKAPMSFSTNPDRSLPSNQQAYQTSPGIPKDNLSFGQSQSPQRSVSSRPGSYVDNAQNQMHMSPSLENQKHPQSFPLLASSPEGGSKATTTPTSITIPSTDHSSVHDRGPSVGPNRDVASDVPTAERTSTDMTKPQAIQEDPLDAKLQHSGQSLERPDAIASNNRTPTQADYADYFRHGSSPTAIVPDVTTTGMEQETSNEDTPYRQGNIRQGGLTALQSKYSTKTAQQGSVVDKDPASFDRNQPSMGLDDLQRGSEDSTGTFHTAGSTVGRNSKNVQITPHQIPQSADQGQSTESSMSKSSSSVSSSITPPVAVPAANLQDQPKARPFSFIQFSQGSTPKALELSSHRRPSVDSLPGRIDPEQDVPPSPVSPQHSMIHEPHDQPGRRSPTRYGVDRDSSANSARPRSNTPSRSFSRPFHEPKSQNHSTVPGERSVTRGDDLPPQHYPAPIPRQDPIHPRQQSTEYSIAGVGPPPVTQSRPRPTESRSSSKRGSRSSAFFKSFRSPTDSASPPLAGERENLEYTNGQDDPTVRKTKSKRSSLFRSLTGGTKSSRSEEIAQSHQDVVSPSQPLTSNDFQPSQRDPVQAGNITKHASSTSNTMEKNDTDTPAKMSSKYRSRLSRPGAPKEKEQPPPEPGKKKRFSGLGSLFGRSKDNRGSNNAQVDGPQEGPGRTIPEDMQQPKARTSRLSSLTKPGRGSAVSSNKTSGRGASYQATRESLAKSGLLAPEPKRVSSRSPEPSAYSETSSRQQQMFPSRHQPLGQGRLQQEQRPTDWPRQSSSTSSYIQPSFMQAPDQHHRVQSTVTTRSNSGYPGGPPEPNQKTRQLPSFTTTTTTTMRGGKTYTSTRSDSLGNNLHRSNSPPPPPPPPKDTWHQARSHQRSTSGTSAVQDPINPPRQASNSQQSHAYIQSATVSSPPRTQTGTYSDQNVYYQTQSTGPTGPPVSQNHPPRFSSMPNHQSLPPLQTNISTTSTPAGPRPYNTTTTNPDPDSRTLRRSQIESSGGTPRAESATIGTAPGMPDPEAARKYRRSQIESGVGTPKADPAAGAPEVVAASGGSNGGEREKKTDASRRSSSKGRKSEDEPIVMTATSFPGQEWQPSHGGWDEY